MNGSPEDINHITSRLRGQMLQMAKHKFASNVCERALAAADPERRRVLIEEIMTPLPDGTIPIAIMMKDQYASEFSHYQFLQLSQYFYQTMCCNVP